MEQTSIPKLLLKLSPPVMLALLIQSIYNIVDSYFVAKYSADGLAALSIIFPIQLLMTALATGTGAGVNILISRMEGSKNRESQKDMVKNGLWLGFFNFAAFAFLGMLFIRPYYAISSQKTAVLIQGIPYGQIVFLGSLGMFLEANCTKILQAKGNMMIPMAAQIFGAILNIVLDPLFIFGKLGFPALGTIGAAIATVIGQWGAMFITLFAVLHTYHFEGKFRLTDSFQIYQAGMPSIIMQSLYTLYIIGLNMILKQFTEDAVTVLGIYYKLQTFFFIPLMGLQQVILPVISFHYGAGLNQRVQETLKYSIGISCSIMVFAVITFMAVPKSLLMIFSDNTALLEIGCHALRVISLSFIPAGFVMMFNVYCQGISRGNLSIFITVLRQVFLLVPLAWLFHFKGLNYVWLTFPVTEVIALLFCLWVCLAPQKASRRFSHPCAAPSTDALAQ